MTEANDSAGWWERNPMVYDWERERSLRAGTKPYFRNIDRRFRVGTWFGHEANEPILSRYIPYRYLSDKLVLVVGCGAGTVTESLTEQGCDVVAVDITERATSLTKERLDVFGRAGEVLRCDARALPFVRDTFDFVWSWGVIHHSPHTDVAVNEIYRVLKQDGEACVMVYHRRSINYMVYTMALRGVLGLELLSHPPQEVANKYSDGAVAKYYTREEAQRMFGSFEQVEVSVAGQRSEMLPKVHRLIKDESHWVDGLISPVLEALGGFLIIKARK